MKMSSFSGDRNLRRFDLEIRVAAIHVVGAQFLQVALQRFTGVAVVLLVPGKPVRRFQLEVLEDVVLAEAGIADDIDLANARPLAFLDVDLDLDAVAGHVLHGGVDAHGVLAARVVLVRQELADVLQHGTIEGLAGRQPDVAQRLGQILGLDVLVALELEAFDRGPLQHHDQQRAAIAAHLHVAEKASVVRCAHRLAHPLRRQAVADVDRKVIVDEPSRHIAGPPRGCCQP
ncbi:MAG: hypothetical protein R3E65_11305 [Steroidobacteraceae bacterium]